jgi:uncharacterized protein YceH (UPF0502 family)
MHRFEELEDVLSALQRLMQRQPSLVKALPRQPGTKEIRYAHLLSDDAESLVERTHPSNMADADISSSSERLCRLETEVARLQEELAQIKEQVARITELRQ